MIARYNTSLLGFGGVSHGGRSLKTWQALLLLAAVCCWRLSAQTSHLVIYALNPEGVLLYSIPGFRAAVIASGLGWSKLLTTNSASITLAAGANTITCSFNGLHFATNVFLTPSETNVLRFIFPRTEFDASAFIDALDLSGSASLSDYVSITNTWEFPPTITFERENTTTSMFWWYSGSHEVGSANTIVANHFESAVWFCDSRAYSGSVRLSNAFHTDGWTLVYGTAGIFGAFDEIIAIAPPAEGPRFNSYYYQSDITGSYPLTFVGPGSSTLFREKAYQLTQLSSSSPIMLNWNNGFRGGYLEMQFGQFNSYAPVLVGDYQQTESLRVDGTVTAMKLSSVPYDVTGDGVHMGDPMFSAGGQVSCRCDSSPVAGTTVHIGPYSADTDKSGAYIIRNISPGTYKVAINEPGYDPFSSLISISMGTSVANNDFPLTPNGQDNGLRKRIVSGGVNWDYTTNPKTLVATFTPQIQGMTLDQAACKLGYAYFNWYQRVLIAPHPWKYAIHAPWNDPPQHLIDGTPNKLPDPFTHIKTWPADDLIFALNEGTDKADPYNRQSPFHTKNGGTLLSFDDSPGDPGLGPGEYMRFVTALVGVRKDLSYDVLSIFFWKTYNNGSTGGIVPDILTQAVPTNGTGGVSEVITNVSPSELPIDVLSALNATGGGFPVTIEPSTQTVQIGGIVTFALSPTNSSSPLAYQWRRNGANVQGATNVVLKLTDVTTNDTGVYEVVLADDNGSIRSAAATLTVVRPPMFQTPVTLTNAKLLLSWTAVQGPTYQVQYKTNLNQTDWLSLGASAQASNTTLTLTDSFALDKQRFYRIQLQ